MVQDTRWNKETRGEKGEELTHSAASPAGLELGWLAANQSHRDARPITLPCLAFAGTVPLSRSVT